MFEFLAKLLGLGGTSQQPAQPATPAMNTGLGALTTPGVQPTQHTGTPVPRSAQVYAHNPMQLGTADKPFTRQTPPNVPSTLNAQVPGNIYQHYTLYHYPNGTSGLEDDNAKSPNSIPFNQAPPLPDQPYTSLNSVKQIGYANPQLRTPMPPSYMSRST